MVHRHMALAYIVKTYCFLALWEFSLCRHGITEIFIGTVVLGSEVSALVSGRLVNSGQLTVAKKGILGISGTVQNVAGQLTIGSFSSIIVHGTFDNNEGNLQTAEFAQLTIGPSNPQGTIGVLNLDKG